MTEVYVHKKLGTKSGADATEGPQDLLF